MVKSSIRRIQVVSFFLSHIPLAALATVLLQDGSDGDWGLIGLCFVATAIAAALLLFYLDRAIKTVVARADPTVP
ncbi:hypothetical protein EU805_16035 [Salipiger sp. IMCC34102]|uniref:hypothetical protein n=1 Tax=Salipiger sp. IMCC34102 TaxID=2510647 RepID=UPI00101BAD86|nr:hypothetical protein [Salipiger sp. IMCC34102]RYH00964.1 hypothetical protein EU805_16035 [Salipiger sp. IMCC34102]